MAAPASDNSSHGRRVIVAWIALSVVATPLVAFVLGPHLPPGNGSSQATEQVLANTWITSLITPVVCLLLVFFVYSLTQFRHRGGALVDGPPLRSDSRVQIWWISLTSLVVLFLAGFGTFELLQNGSGGGQGPDPIAIPKGQKIPVQVIAQQWQFTYRYPTYGGVETPQLVLPADSYVELHVTSLDAIHSFWAYELGVKADANPGVDNVAYVKTKGPRTFHVRCAELCGLWHGYMFNNGRVVPMSQFTAWIKAQRKEFEPVAKYLPKYADVYYPDPQRRAG
ncbi:MAG TPA: cytochrome c oxidase subunit II [Gaiellaceae bacterium]|nr:cytochrome c oxidase subunit II [Gaiellaceae bacterium]